MAGKTSWSIFFLKTYNFFSCYVISCYFILFQKLMQIGFLFQHVQILSEELRVGVRTRLWRGVASAEQLGFQCRQWESRTEQQEQPRHSAEGSYLLIITGCHRFYFVFIGSLFLCLPGVFIGKVTDETHNVSVRADEVSVSPRSGLASLFRSSCWLMCRHLLSRNRSAGEFAVPKSQ